MGNTTRQLAHRLHFLRLLQLSLQFELIGDVALDGGIINNILRCVKYRENRCIFMK